METAFVFGFHKDLSLLVIYDEEIKIPLEHPSMRIKRRKL